MSEKPGSESALEKPLRASNHASKAEAAAELLGALERIPTHYRVDRMSIWQFAELAGRNAGKWCWSFTITATIGGYDREFSTPTEIREQRRVQAVNAISEARAATDEPVESSA